jgi:organic hydroperoxide reductase OsmC/OhrA
MSTATTGADTEASLLATGLVGDVVGRLDRLRDVDEWADAVEVAATVPGSLFAAAVADCYERATL